MAFQDFHSALLFLVGPLSALTALALCALEGAAVSYTAKQNPLSASNINGFLPLCVLFAPALGLLTLRAYEGAVLGGALILTAANLGWAFVFVLSYGVALWCKVLFASGRAAQGLAETMPALGGLGFCWLVALFARSLFGYILLLELAGLCLIFLLITAKNLSCERAKLATFQAALTFLWVSIFSLFAMLWALHYNFTSWPLFLTDALPLAAAFSPSANVAAVFLPVAFFLKLMVLPWQGLLVAFYRQLSLGALLTYNVFYYPAFLLTALPVFSGLVALTPAIVGGAASALMVAAVLSLAGAQAPTVDLRNMLALSSAFNIIFLAVSFFFFL